MYRIVVEQDEDGAFCARVPALPGCHSDGRTYEEAVEHIAEAIEAYRESHEKAGDHLPQEV